MSNETKATETDSLDREVPVREALKIAHDMDTSGHRKAKATAVRQWARVGEVSGSTAAAGAEDHAGAVPGQPAVAGPGGPRA